MQKQIPPTRNASFFGHQYQEAQSQNLSLSANVHPVIQLGFLKEVIETLAKYSVSVALVSAAEKYAELYSTPGTAVLAQAEKVNVSDAREYKPASPMIGA